jgi:hypothetical protein
LRVFPTALQPTTKCQSDTKSQPRRYVDDYFFSRAYRGIHDGLYRSKGKLDMTEYYKGQRISELLRDIDKMTKALVDNQDAFENKAQELRAVEALTTLAIAKAKLTALQGDK